MTLCPGKLRTALQTAAHCSEHQCSPSSANSSEGNVHPKPFQLLSSPFQSPSSAIPIACAIGGSILFILIILVWKREYPQANGSNAGLMHVLLSPWLFWELCLAPGASAVFILWEMLSSLQDCGPIRGPGRISWWGCSRRQPVQRICSITCFRTCLYLFIPVYTLSLYLSGPTAFWKCSQKTLLTEIRMGSFLSCLAHRNFAACCHCF